MVRSAKCNATFQVHEKLTCCLSLGIDTPRHSATLSLGTPGVLHGVRTYLLQSKAGQIIESHSICAGLDYPGVGPEHAWLKDSGRAEYVAATDEECLRGFRACTQMEGIIPALETAHAVWGTMQIAKTMRPDQNIVMCLSGRGDKVSLACTRIHRGRGITDGPTLCYRTSPKFVIFCPSGKRGSTGM